jgi:outer membrane protein assembly factor BamB
MTRLCLVLALAACSPSLPTESGSPWPKFRNDAPQSGATPLHPSASGGDVWSFRTGKGVFASPVVARDGTVYVGSADTTFYALHPDGSLRWSVPTGEIIDSAALLDDRGRIYFGSGDGFLRALDGGGNVVWSFQAEDPVTTGGFIRWFEGNVGMDGRGRLWVPNDNFRIYIVDRDTGASTSELQMPDQTWALPAQDLATGRTFVANNNLVSIKGPNLYAYAADGSSLWTASITGTIAASPLFAEGRVIVGGFDGYVHAYAAADGTLLWTFQARDHIYASAARQPDGTIVVPSTDGTVYGLDPATGTPRWTFDTDDPIRSSPAIDGDGRVYFGGGDGRLYALEADGTLRWSVQLIDEDRNDLNASPALGAGAVYIGGESGEVFGVPYDSCLSANGMGRCTSPAAPVANRMDLVPTTPFGGVTTSTAVDGNQPIVLSLVVTDGAGKRQQAVLDPTMLTVTSSPANTWRIDVAGNGTFVTLTPTTSFTTAFSVDVSAGVRSVLMRAGLQVTDTTPIGTATKHLDLTVTPSPTAPVSYPVAPGNAQTVWALSRLSVPLPTLMPSYNQIGFDSLGYNIGLVEQNASHSIAFLIGAGDPATQARFALDVRSDGGLITFESFGAFRIVFNNISLPFSTFRIASRLDATGNGARAATLTGGAVCKQISFYGQFLEQLGLCNATTDVMTFVAAANFGFAGGGSSTGPTGIGTVGFAAWATGVTATLTGTSLRAADHAYTVLLIDTATGAPLLLDYGGKSKVVADAGGLVSTVSIGFGTVVPPAAMRAYLLVDTYPAASGNL